MTFPTDRRGDSGHKRGLHILYRFILALALGLSFLPSAQAAEPAQKRVLILYSFESEVGLYSDFDEALRATLQTGGAGPLTFYTEYLDLARFPGPAHEKDLQSQLKDKYSAEKPDLIFSVSLPAIDFIRSHGEELFPGVPVVICAVDRRWIARRPLPPDLTGVVETTKIGKTLAAALQLQPDTRRVVVVGGTLPYEREWMQEIRNDLREYEGTVEFTYLTDLPMDELLETLVNLPDHTIVLYMMMWRDGAGEYFLPKEVLRRMAESANAPIYGVFDGYLGSGIVGGYLVPFATAGTMAARVGLRILKGSAPDSIPVLSEDNARYSFDARQLRRWKIDGERLPAGSVVLFKPTRVWEVYRRQIVSVILLIIAEGLLISALMVQLRKRRRAEAILGTSEQKYRELYENMMDGFVRVGMDGRILECNDAYVKLLGYEREELLQLAYRDLTPEKWNVFTEGIIREQILRQGYSPLFEKEYRRKDGTLVPVELRSFLMRDKAGRPSGIWTTVRDITERKRAEETLGEYRKAVESSRDIIAVVNRDYRYLLANRPFLEGLSLERDQVVGHTVSEVLGAEFFEGVAKAKFDACFAGKAVHYETKYVSKKNGERDVFASYFPIEGPQGTDRAFCVIQDITERKRAEAELADRLRFETLLAELSSRFVHLPAEQIDGEINCALRRVCESLGMEMASLWRPTLSGPGAVTLTHSWGPVAGPPFDDHLNGQELFPWCFGQISAGKVVAVSSLEELPPEATRDRENWRQFGIKSNLTIGLAVGGDSIAWALSFNTLQEQHAWPEPLVKRLEMVAQIFSHALARQSSDRALKESEERFRSLVENATVGIYRTTPDGRILAANSAMVKMLGYADFESLAARNLEEEGFEPHYSRREFRDRMERDGQVIGLEMGWTRQDGSTIFVRESARAIRGADGKILYYDGIVEDITERKRAEEALRQRNKYIETVFENAPIGFAVHTISDGVGRFVSARYEDIYGVRRGAIDSHYTFFDKVWPYNPAFREELRRRVVADMTSGDAARMHWEKVPLWNAAGQVRYINAMNIPLPEQDLMVSTVEDVTASVEAEEALRKQAAFDGLMTEVLSRFATCPPSEVDTAVVESLRGIAKFIGADHAYVVRFSADGATWSATHEWFGPEVGSMFRNYQAVPMGTVPRTERMLQEGKVVRINSPDDYGAEEVAERRHREAEGHLAALNIPIIVNQRVKGNIGLHCHAHPLPWSDDDVVRLSMVGDAVVTALDRKQSLEELRKSEEKFSKAFHASPVAMTILSLVTGRYIEVNKAFEENSEYRAHEIIGRTPKELGLNVNPAGLEMIIHAMRDPERFRDLETQYRTKSGEIRTVLLSTELIEFGGEPCSLRVMEDITDRKRIELSQRELGARMLMVQEEERRRVARELHDDFSQRLALLAIDLEQLAQRPEATRQEWTQRLQAMWAQTQELTTDIHRLSYQLHPSKLEDLGLVAAVRGYCHELSRQGGLEVKFSSANVPPCLPKEIALCIYRVVQEALRNVVKHSGAKTVGVDLGGGSREVSLVVADSGKGFDVNVARNSGGLGLVSMQERVRYAGGTWSVDTHPSGGTRIVVRIPVPAAAEAKGN
ncbi:MAG TPA: PAS domain S-box protein [Terriglobia bacterium]|nr:PAS domain S-box protein [Terriglobia bacterium]